MSEVLAAALWRWRALVEAASTGAPIAHLFEAPPQPEGVPPYAWRWTWRTPAGVVHCRVGATELTLRYGNEWRWVPIDEHAYGTISRVLWREYAQGVARP